MAESGNLLESGFGQLLADFHRSATEQQESRVGDIIVLTSFREVRGNGNKFMVGVQERQPELDAYARLVSLQVAYQEPIIQGRFRSYPTRGFEAWKLDMVTGHDRIIQTSDLKAVFRDRVRFPGFRYHLSYGGIRYDGRLMGLTSIHRSPIIDRPSNGILINRTAEQEMIEDYIPKTLGTISVIRAVLEGDISNALRQISKPLETGEFVADIHHPSKILTKI